MDYVLNALEYLKPSKLEMTSQIFTDLNDEEQLAVIEKSQELMNETIKLSNKNQTKTRKKLHKKH